jgi:hypothetical protein
MCHLQRCEYVTAKGTMVEFSPLRSFCNGWMESCCRLTFIFKSFGYASYWRYVDYITGNDIHDYFQRMKLSPNIGSKRHKFVLQLH